MALTPGELRQIKPSRSLLGYNRRFVDELLDDVVDSFEVVWRERADLADKVERLEEDLVRYRELETLLRTTLVSAERASQELREQARREATVVVEEAHAEARRLKRGAFSDLERMATEARRLKTLLPGALATLDDGENGSDTRHETEARAA